MKKEIVDKKNHWIQYDAFDSHVIHAFTLKPYNFSSLIEEKTKEKFYQTLTKDLSCSCEIVKPKQEHTDVIKMVTEENKKDPFLSVDGLLTNIPKVALVTSYADCQAIFLYDPVHKVIGNIHSGWKGTIKKILRKAILMMQEVYGSNPKDIKAMIGPSILSCCFEVDEDVKDLFVETFENLKVMENIKLGNMKDGKQKYFIDTMGINYKEMLSLGLQKEHICLSSICTKCNKDWMYSYRGDPIENGRNIAFICLKGD